MSFEKTSLIKFGQVFRNWQSFILFKYQHLFFLMHGKKMIPPGYLVHTSFSLMKVNHFTCTLIFLPAHINCPNFCGLLVYVSLVCFEAWSHVIKYDLELLIYCLYFPVLACVTTPGYVVLGIKPSALCMLGNHSTN